MKNKKEKNRIPTEKTFIKQKGYPCFGPPITKEQLLALKARYKELREQAGL